MSTASYIPQRTVAQRRKLYAPVSSQKAGRSPIHGNQPRWLSKAMIATPSEVNKAMREGALKRIFVFFDMT